MASLHCFARGAKTSIHAGVLSAMSAMRAVQSVFTPAYAITSSTEDAKKRFHAARNDDEARQAGATDQTGLI